jgi:membrane fusion protein (multidrug efflux system)
MIIRKSVFRMFGWGVPVLLLAAALTLSGCQVSVGGGKDGGGKGDKADGEGEAREREAVPVEVAALELGHIEVVLRFASNLEAERDVQVFAQAPRIVKQLQVEEGNAVRAGQLLVKLQDDMQHNALAKVNGQLAQAQRELARQEKLFRQELISEQVYNEASYNVEQLLLARDDAERELAYTSVEAPISGVVVSRMVNLGDYVTVNQPLFQIVDFDSIVARIFVPEKELSRLRVGQTARIRADAMGDLVFSGRVDRIAPAVDPGTGTVKVTVAIPRQEGLRPGMYVEVELVAATKDDALLVPKRALVYENDQIFVFRLAGERDVERVRLVPQLENARFVEPLEGFQVGDLVVTAGQSGLKDGALVKLPGDPDEEKTESAADTEEGGEEDDAAVSEAAGEEADVPDDGEAPEDAEVAAQ